MKDDSKKAPRRGGRPSKEQAGKIEDKILDAAASLFFDHGYGAVSIEQIAKRARISKRTFYTRFDDKAALFRAVVHRLIMHLRPPNDATEALFKGANAEEILRRIAPIILKASLNPDSLSLQRVVLAEAKRFPELALIMNEQGSRQEAIRRIAELLQHEAKGQKNPVADPHLLAEQFLFMLTAAPQRRAMGMGKAMTAQQLDDWAVHSVDVFLRGCWCVTRAA